MTSLLNTKDLLLGFSVFSVDFMLSTACTHCIETRDEQEATKQERQQKQASFSTPISKASAAPCLKKNVHFEKKYRYLGSPILERGHDNLQSLLSTTCGSVAVWAVLPLQFPVTIHALASKSSCLLSTFPQLLLLTRQHKGAAHPWSIRINSREQNENAIIL